MLTFLGNFGFGIIDSFFVSRPLFNSFLEKFSQSFLSLAALLLNMMKGNNRSILIFAILLNELIFSIKENGEILIIGLFFLI